MNQIVLAILLLIVGFLAGVIVSCSTVLLKIEKITHTKSVNSAISKIKTYSTQINKITKDINGYSKKVAHLDNYVKKAEQKENRKAVENNKK